MKKRILSFMSFCLFLSAISGCTQDNLKTKTFNYFYEINPESLNYLANEQPSNTYLFSNCVEGLMENDPQGNTKGAMAKSWSVSDDGLTYTYNIRSKVPWVEASGTPYKDEYVKPSDFITGLKHAIKSKSESLYLVTKSIKGLDKYLTKEDPDFSHVGIKADDKKGTLTYTLNEPEPYWHSKTLHSVLFPVNEKFLKEKGKKFGKVKADSILYNGPFTVTTLNSLEIKMKANPHYYDSRHVHINKINLSFISTNNADKKYENFIKGKTAACILNPSDNFYDKAKKQENSHILLDLPKSSTNFLTFNLNRSTFKYTNLNKDTVGTHKAILNFNFRQALSYAIDKESYNAQSVGKEAGLAEVRNALVQPDFVMVGEKSYGSVLQEKLQALNPEWEKVSVAKDGVNDSFKVELAKQYLTKAKAELAADGVSFPIHLDYLEESGASRRIKRIKVLKQAIENSLGKENVVVDIQSQPRDKVMPATYLGTTPEVMDWDIWINGFYPDFQDPLSYLRIFDPRNGAYMHSLGLHQSESKSSLDSSEKQALQAVDFEKYAQLLDQANQLKQKDQLPERFTSSAKAEAHLLNQRILVPIRTDVSLVMLRVKPFSWSYGGTGCMRLTSWQTPRFKYVELQKDAVSKEDYEKEKRKFEDKVKEATIMDRKEG